ncbi:MAG: UvrD-helicase domain-containing protein [Alphaproteobacteria bacterium]
MNIFDLAEPEDTISQLTSQPTPWLDGLNPEQKQAVETTDGPVLVLSGAGTGKTKVLTSRLAYILSLKKAWPSECFVVTFTNKAAKEMKERVFNIIGDMASSVWLGTFHGLCAKMLRVHAELVGLKSNFTILSDDDQKRLIKQIEEEFGLDTQKFPPQAFLDLISRWKDKGLTPEKLGTPKNAYAAQIYKRYQERLVELNCADFGDLILYVLEILMKHADVLDYYQNKFKYIMVDEYQDTNVSQYLLLRLLSQKYRNICCVGDDDQSIYSWRGAEIENILRFEKDFTEALTVRLERNYRSTSNILTTASKLISHNTGRLGKKLYVAENSPAANSNNHKVKVISTYSGSDEAKFVVEEIEALARAGVDYSRQAVLVRTGFQTREFEEKFIANAIPYQVIGGPKFYERQEIRDALAYFRVVMQPSDDLAFERIVNKPARSLGDKSIEAIKFVAKEKHISMFEAAKITELKGKAKNNLAELMANFKIWQASTDSLKPDELASMILDDSGYIDMLKNDKSVEAPGRLENLRELLNVLSDSEQYPDMATFLEHVSLVIEKDDATDFNRVLLITLHSAKGLEFDVVYLPGWEEGLFPHQRSLDESGSEGLEEERRLAYVAITRAKRKLYILAAMNRRIYGQWQQNIPSRFLNELPKETLEITNNSYYKGYR